jgi:hypothetical protein
LAGLCAAHQSSSRYFTGRITGSSGGNIHMKKLSVLFGAALLAGTALLAAAPAQAGDELTIVSWGGAYQESQRKAFMDPFVAAGNKVTEEEYNGEIAKLRAMVEANAITWDVVDVDTQTALAACAEGVLETIDWGKLGLDRSKFIGGDLQDCAVPNIVYSTVLAYDTTKLNPPPTQMTDLFDMAKFPGKRALQKSPFVNLECDCRRSRRRCLQGSRNAGASGLQARPSRRRRLVGSRHMPQLLADGRW